ncbi:MAG TPA: undecaprenyl-diphosphate phosphatase, partial [Dehalococcoidia bacterium]|nr:undecaprenyl-diphosphate phosphatase [Dehalococcoidia bacterium]
AMIIVFALVLFVAERLNHQQRSLGSSGWKDALSIGGAQAISLIPGVSRSGVTISAGLLRGFSREQAARFSFLISTPAILGAALLKMTEALSEGVSAQDARIMVAGALAATVFSWLSIGFLLRLLQTRSFLPFISYRAVAGVFVLVYFSL